MAEINSYNEQHGWYSVKWNKAVVNILWTELWSLVTCWSLSSAQQRAEKKPSTTKLYRLSAVTPLLQSSSFLTFPFSLRSSLTSCLSSVFIVFLHKVVTKLRLSQVLMCSAVKCVLQSSLPALSWLVFPVLWPSRSWLTSCVSPNWKKD